MWKKNRLYPPYSEAWWWKHYAVRVLLSGRDREIGKDWRKDKCRGVLEENLLATCGDVSSFSSVKISQLTDVPHPIWRSLRGFSKNNGGNCLRSRCAKLAETHCTCVRVFTMLRLVCGLEQMEVKQQQTGNSLQKSVIPESHSPTTKVWLGVLLSDIHTGISTEESHETGAWWKLSAPVVRHNQVIHCTSNREKIVQKAGAKKGATEQPQFDKTHHPLSSQWIS